ncbi:hypothetical protein PSACC_01266 [Paramicrosporidium saccamoebae]|uniref:RING-type domain-containing protein n=1 Tax=Paramicrosporidium saccamoebae TaxID=1246581 RepID=A0A2H9TMF1_9FUNG|nr:hypothetical protein PSACC_01266 [Paramicrosporidium saccamoebae]
MVIAVVAAYQRKPSCHCFLAAAVYIDEGLRIDQRLPLVSRAPAVFNLLMVIYAASVGAAGVFHSLWMKPSHRTDMLFVLSLHSLMLSFMGTTHIVCRFYYQRLFFQWIRRGQDITDLEDVVVNHPPVDVSPYVVEVEESSECPICSDTITDRVCVLPCQHKFHVVCAETWLRRVPSCPMCRVRVSLRSLPVTAN